MNAICIHVFVFAYEFWFDVNWNINFIHYSHLSNNNKYDCKMSYNNLKIIAKEQIYVYWVYFQLRYFAATISIFHRNKCIENSYNLWVI